MKSRSPFLHSVIVTMAVLGIHSQSSAQETEADPVISADAIAIWPDLAPGETTKETGTKMPPRGRITRVEQITSPTMTVHAPDNPNGTAVLILPGGGFRFTVPDLEGSDAAKFLIDSGITCFVLNYRVTADTSDMAWRKPTQDSQRAVRWIRANAEKYKLNPERIGLLGFSAGGQAAAAHLTSTEALYESVDVIDEQPSLPNFGMLVYPWRIEAEDGKLKPMIQVTEATPPTLIISTHDDKGAVSTGAAKLYIALKENNVDGELHIYRSGGHGYGTSKRKNSVIHKWAEVATDWLRLHGLTAP